MYQITVTEFGIRPYVTRICIGCAEPARDTFDKLCSKLHGQKHLVTFRVVAQVPERSPEELERARQLVESVANYQPDDTSK